MVVKLNDILYSEEYKTVGRVRRVLRDSAEIVEGNGKVMYVDTNKCRPADFDEKMAFRNKTTNPPTHFARLWE